MGRPNIAGSSLDRSTVPGKIGHEVEELLVLGNSEVAAKLVQIRHLLELSGEPVFRYAAYERAAATLENASPVADLIAHESLRTLPGIGASLAATIEALSRSGTAPVLDDLVARYPLTLLELLDIDGLGSKTAKRLFDEYGITSAAELDAALRAGTLDGMPRVGPKTLSTWRASLLHARRKRTPLGIALAVARDVIAYLGEAGLPIAHLVAAGSLRRAEPLVGDIDLVCTSDEASIVMEHFTHWQQARDIIADGPTKASIWMHDGLQLDLRVLPDDRYGNLLQHFTGSREHNILLREYALRRGISVSENGMTELATGRVLRYRTEEEVYAQLDLAYIPPELRVGGDEIERAAARTLPQLVELTDVRGDFHMHTTASDGDDHLEAMIRACSERGYAYLAISEHSPGRGVTYGVTPERLREQHAKIRALGTKYGITTLCATEVDIRSDGTLDYDNATLASLDFVIASVHGDRTQNPEAMTARLIRACHNPYVNVIGHPTGRMLDGFPGFAFDVEAVFRAAAHTGTALEIDGQTNRLDLPSNLARRACELGCMLTTDSDAHRISDLANIEPAISQARRAGLRREDILNTYPLEDVRAFVAKKRSKK